MAARLLHSSPQFPSPSTPNPPHLSPIRVISSLPFTTSLTFPLRNSPSSHSKFKFFHHPNEKKRRIGAVAEESTAGAVEIVNRSEDGSTVVIQVLLFAAFVGLSVLTVGVIYLAVSDFLQKREAEKIGKEVAEKEKRVRKKERVKAKAGLKGFGR
ncbi:hypothetical protein Droror1_Dr00003281 [Drosera rotundifolia]